jgi:hypothetical protein
MALLDIRTPPYFPSPFLYRFQHLVQCADAADLWPTRDTGKVEAEADVTEG